MDSLTELEKSLDRLRMENNSLNRKVTELESRLRDTGSSPSDGVSNLSDNDRIALRNQIQTYIKRIDQLLEKE